jgi:hypothetical protein
MDYENSTTDSGLTDGDGQYVRRAQALMARRAELFTRAPALSPTRAPTAQDRSQRTRRTGGRQLSLPIARDRGLRQARMLR